MGLGATPSAGGLGAAKEVPGAIGASGGRLAGASAWLSVSVATGTLSGTGSTVGGTTGGAVRAASASPPMKSGASGPCHSRIRSTSPCSGSAQLPW